MLITPEYQAQLAQLHRDRPDWGTTGRGHAQIVSSLIVDHRPQNVLDYGCGKQTLARALKGFRIMGYDPGIPGLEGRPDPVDMVVCTDVLEHIEPDCLDDVLDDLQRITRMLLYADVHLGAAVHKLPDGRNAHLIQQGYRWWLDRLLERFDLISANVSGQSLQVVLSARKPKGNGIH